MDGRIRQKLPRCPGGNRHRWCCPQNLPVPLVRDHRAVLEVLEAPEVLPAQARLGDLLVQ